MHPKPESAVTIRVATKDDIQICAEICYRAFSAINRTHNFPCDFPVPEAAAHAISSMFTHPAFYCVVAEIEGRIVGSNCLDERSAITGVGPITIDPEVQNTGIGRRLMQAVIDRSQAKGADGIRLVQAAFHNRSLSLYAGLGFEVREPLSCMQGRTTARSMPGCAVRPAQAADREQCDRLFRRLHGFDRGTELAEAIEQGSAKVVERDERITGYATSLAFFGHATAETNRDLEALMASVESFGGAGVLVPTRNADLFRWCLSNGLRVVQPMTLMAMGLYHEPAGASLPSISF
jgi:predicted N-acetyltransferase YhbS